MKPFTMAEVMLLLGAGLLVPCAPAGPQSSRSTPNHAASVTGVIGDVVCGRKHAMGGATDAECTRECVRRGSQYALIAGEKIYTLQGGPPDTLDKLAGARVSVLGTVDGDTILVKSITAESSH